MPAVRLGAGKLSVGGHPSIVFRRLLGQTGWGQGEAQSRPGIAAGGDFMEGLLRRRHSRSVSATC